MRVSLKALPGVQSVNVSLDNGRAAVKMKPGNSTTLKQLQDAVARNGFTMKQSDATVAGSVVLSNGKAQLKISGSGDVLALTAEPKAVSDATLTDGELVIVTGTISEPSKGRSPDSMAYRAVVKGTQ